MGFMNHMIEYVYLFALAARNLRTYLQPDWLYFIFILLFGSKWFVHGFIIFSNGLKEL